MINFKVGDVVEFLLEDVDTATIVYFDGAYLLGWKPNQIATTYHYTVKPEVLVQHYYGIKLEEIVGFDKFKWVHHAKDLKLVQMGHHCVSCNQYYPDAVSNLPNNKLKCWSCRNT